MLGRTAAVLLPGASNSRRGRGPAAEEQEQVQTEERRDGDDDDEADAADSAVRGVVEGSKKNSSTDKRYQTIWRKWFPVRQLFLFPFTVYAT